MFLTPCLIEIGKVNDVPVVHKKAVKQIWPELMYIPEEGLILSVKCYETENPCQSIFSRKTSFQETNA